MIEVSVFYPNRDGAKLDFEYLRDSHLPMAMDLLVQLG
jgi:hypothetical protein